jgi:hypothetical protein
MVQGEARSQISQKSNISWNHAPELRHRPLTLPRYDQAEAGVPPDQFADLEKHPVCRPCRSSPTTDQFVCLQELPDRRLVREPVEAPDTPRAVPPQPPAVLSTGSSPSCGRSRSSPSGCYSSCGTNQAPMVAAAHICGNSLSDALRLFVHV